MPKLLKLRLRKLSSSAASMMRCRPWLDGVDMWDAVNGKVGNGGACRCTAVGSMWLCSKDSRFAVPAVISRQEWRVFLGAVSWSECARKWGFGFSRCGHNLDHTIFPPPVRLLNKLSPMKQYPSISGQSAWSGFAWPLRSWKVFQSISALYPTTFIRDDDSSCALLPKAASLPPTVHLRR